METTRDGFVWRECKGGVEIINYLKKRDSNDIVIPSKINGKPVISIGRDAFKWGDMQRVSLPNSVTLIKDNAFVDCFKLTAITIPNSVIEIGDGAFATCTSLTEVSIPDSVTTIGSGAFGGCSKLRSVTIGKGLRKLREGISFSYIGRDNVFGYCTSLTDINVDVANEYFSSVNGVLFNKNQDTLICYPAGLSGQYEVPDNVKKIGRNAFEGCYYLTSVTIPNSVTEIEQNAFYDCRKLIELSMPDLQYIKMSDIAFVECNDLRIATFHRGGTLNEIKTDNAYARIDAIQNDTDCKIEKDGDVYHVKNDKLDLIAYVKVLNNNEISVYSILNDSKGSNSHVRNMNLPPYTLNWIVHVLEKNGLIHKTLSVDH